MLSYFILVGILLGKLSVKLGLIKIIEKYTVLPSDKMQLPMKFDPRTLFITNRPIGGFWFKFKKTEQQFYTILINTRNDNN